MKQKKVANKWVANIVSDVSVIWEGVAVRAKGGLFYSAFFDKTHEMALLIPKILKLLHSLWNKY